MYIVILSLDAYLGATYAIDATRWRVDGVTSNDRSDAMRTHMLVFINITQPAGKANSVWPVIWTFRVCAASLSSFLSFGNKTEGNF